MNRIGMLAAALLSGAVMIAPAVAQAPGNGGASGSGAPAAGGSGSARVGGAVSAPSGPAVTSPGSAVGTASFQGGAASGNRFAANGGRFDRRMDFDHDFGRHHRFFHRDRDFDVGFGFFPGYAYDYPYDDTYAYYPDEAYPVAGVTAGQAFCMRRYRSYDPVSGTFLGFDGLRHPCP